MIPSLLKPILRRRQHGSFGRGLIQTSLRGGSAELHISCTRRPSISAQEALGSFWNQGTQSGLSGSRAIILWFVTAVIGITIWFQALFWPLTDGGHNTSAETFWFSALSILPLAALLAIGAFDAYRLAKRHE